MSFVIKPCASGTVFVINFDSSKLHDKSRGFDFQKIVCAAKSQKSKFSVVVETPQILLLKSGNSEITIYKSGKILAKNVSSKEDAEKLASDFEKLI